MLQKGVCPYEYMDDWEKFNETSLPEKKKKKKKKILNTSNIHTTCKFLGEEPRNKMELEINRLLLYYYYY